MKKGPKPRPDAVERRKASQAKVQRGRLARFYATVASIKNVPCADCGGKFPAVCMDFDHRPGEKKIKDVSGMWVHSVKALMEEIAKCDIVCANCHRLRTLVRAHNGSEEASSESD